VESVPSEQALSCLLSKLDASLCKFNVEYAQKRASRRLNAPQLWLMKPGWFERTSSARLQSAGRDVQFKAQLLSTTPESADEILCIIEAEPGRAE
jgi:hypothetical protein